MIEEQVNGQEKADQTLPDHVFEDRRLFLKQTMAFAGFTLAPVSFLTATPDDIPIGDHERVKLSVTINGQKRRLSIDPRMTTLDLLREKLTLTGTKKGCDLGQCGACTILIDGQRTLSCLSLAIMQHGKKITTVESLSEHGNLHPMQQAFIKHDGFQCGYCTPGQLMSAIACIREGCAGSDDEIREYMSGNLCRCGAYPNIVNAISDIKNRGQKV